MLSEKGRRALIDIQHHIHSVEKFTAGLTRDGFEASEIHFAVTRALEIISEASRRLPDEMRAANADLPWHQIMSAGNVYRHEYDGIAPGRVWETAKDHLPALKNFVERQLEAHG